MSFSYSGDPSSSSLDAVRFLIGDTDTTDPLLQDEEVQFLLDQFDSDVYNSAAASADSISAKFAREVSFSTDGITVGVNELQKKYDDLAANLRSLAKHESRIAKPYVGGVFKSDITLDDNNNDIVPLAIRAGIHDNIRAGAADSGFVYDPELSLSEPQIHE